MKIKRFSQSTIENIGYYVYCLFDTRDGKIFYVGKGKGNRVFNHMHCAIEGNGKSEKIATIKDIIKNGKEVGHFIVRYSLDEISALEIESTIIDLLTYQKFFMFKKISNIVLGHHAWDRGIRTVDEIEEMYSLAPIYNSKIKHKVMIININKSYKRGMSPYDATRKSWRLNINRAKKVQYVISDYKGILRAIYKPKQWLQQKNNKRWYFEGEEVTDRKIQNMYLNKLYKGKRRGQSNPILYINC